MNSARGGGLMGKKTLKEWEAEKLHSQQMQFYNYHGFDQKDSELLTRLFTEAEFDDAAMRCTQVPLDW